MGQFLIFASNNKQRRNNSIIRVISFIVNLNIMSAWPLLRKPPVVTAIFQILYENNGQNLEDFLRIDKELRNMGFSHRTDNLEANVNVDKLDIPLGTSRISAITNTKLTNYIYCSEDRKLKLTIGVNNITLVDETDYAGWDNYKTKTLSILNLLSPILDGISILRTSIRFINQFSFMEFSNPMEYFRTTISAADGAVPFPVAKYAFRINLTVSDDIHSVVNHLLDKASEKFIYIFDIDVLCRKTMPFNLSLIEEQMEILREAKNNIFFNNVTEKLISLCN